MMDARLCVTIAVTTLGVAACGGASPAVPTVIVPPPTSTNLSEYSGTWHGTLQDDAGRSGEVTVTLRPPVFTLLSGVWTTTLSEPIYGGGTVLASGNPSGAPGL